MNEADTCRTYVVPMLQTAGWENAPYSIAEQRVFTNPKGRIRVVGGRIVRGPPKRADYLLRYRPDFPIAVVEAKADYKTPGAGLSQAKDYAEILDLKFTYSTNGLGIVEFDYRTGIERSVDRFPTPEELWARLHGESPLTAPAEERVLSPFYHDPERLPRYYQQIAIHRAVDAILRGKNRVLITMATGTGKTVVAFQICYKLWSTRWNRTNDPVKRPKILFLADRNILVDDPKDKTFLPFGDARHKIESGDAIKSREMYFATYQSIAEDANRPGLYREYAPDFFDLIVIDECHRGSSRQESNWRDILDYFSPAVQIGMTATPLRKDNKATYRYFGNPVYQYSLRQGLADEMRQLLSNLNADIVKNHPDYVCRVTSDEGQIGKGHLGRFQELETYTPVILTTSQLLSTGVDAPLVRNVVLIRVIGTMTEFKQIIGRGCRPSLHRTQRVKNPLSGHSSDHDLQIGISLTLPSFRSRSGVLKVDPGHVETRQKSHRPDRRREILWGPPEHRHAHPALPA